MFLARRGKQSHRKENSKDALANEGSHNALAQLSVSRRRCKTKARWAAQAGSVGQLSVGGGAHEGQPGLTLVFAKAVSLHQWVQSVGWVWSQSSCARCSAPRRVQLRPWRLKRRPTCTSIFFSMTPLPLRTGARRRPNERRSDQGMLCQLSIPSRLPRM